MPFEPNDILNMHGQVDQDALRALIEQAAQSGGVMMGGGSYYQSPQGSAFVPDQLDPIEIAFASAYIDRLDPPPGAPPGVPVAPSTWTTLRLNGLSAHGGLFQDPEHPERAIMQANGYYLYFARVHWDDAAYDYSDGPRELRIQYATRYATPTEYYTDVHTTALPSGSGRQTTQTVVGFGLHNAGAWVQVQVRHEAASERSLDLSSVTGEGATIFRGYSFGIMRLGASDVPEFPDVIDGGDDDL